MALGNCFIAVPIVPVTILCGALSLVLLKEGLLALARTASDPSNPAGQAQKYLKHVDFMINKRLLADVEIELDFPSIMSAATLIVLVAVAVGVSSAAEEAKRIAKAGTKSGGGGGSSNSKGKTPKKK